MSPEPVAYTPPGDVRARTGRWRVLTTFWIAFALACGAGVVITLVERADPPPPPCPPNKQCGGPPRVLPPGRLRTWRSRSVGISFQYSPRLFEVVDRSGASIRLRLRGERPDGVEGDVWVTGARDRDTSPAELLQERQDELSTSILGLTEDDDPATVLPPPRLGNVPAIGGSFRGTVDTPQGPSGPAVVTIIAAGAGDASAVVSFALTGTVDSNEIRTLRSYLTPSLTSFAWRTTASR